MGWKIKDGVLLLDEQAEDPSRLGEDDAILYVNDEGDWEADISSGNKFALGDFMPRRMSQWLDEASYFVGNAPQTYFSSTYVSGLFMDVRNNKGTTTGYLDELSGRGISFTGWEWRHPLAAGNYKAGMVYAVSGAKWADFALFVDQRLVHSFDSAGGLVGAYRVIGLIPVLFDGLHTLTLVKVGRLDENAEDIWNYASYGQANRFWMHEENS